MLKHLLKLVNDQYLLSNKWVKNKSSLFGTVNERSQWIESYKKCENDEDNSIEEALEGSGIKVKDVRRWEARSCNLQVPKQQIKSGKS